MLHSISPVDGRYAGKTRVLSDFFSEAALIRYRCHVEIEYLIALAETDIIPSGQLEQNHKTHLRTIVSQFTDDDAMTVKEIEAGINHDVKAVEYFIRKKLELARLHHLQEWVHFGLTSQDINNSAFPLMIREAYALHLIPAFDTVRDTLYTMATDTRDIPMLAHTHGQPASPTTLGKEIMVFVDRIDVQTAQLRSIRLPVKFGGATGNFNAHVAAFPQIDWNEWADRFTQTYLGTTRYRYTTQIEPYDQLAALCHATMRLNTILIDLSRDIWTYISMQYLSQKSNPNEVGSSAMPHKVNPIDFENAEGNLGYANAIFSFLADKLPVSRLQRDLTDSTVLRNIGVPVAHTFLALQSLGKGLSKIIPNTSHLLADLDHNWAVLAEAIQTILRREGVSQPYELLKNLTRGKVSISKQDLHDFIHTLQVEQAVKDELLQLRPDTYTGVHFRPKS